MTTSPAELVPVDFDPFADGQVIEAVPLTPAQREIWLACQAGTEASLAYNLSVTIHVGGDLDAEALARALRRLVARHDALRMTFDARGRRGYVADDPPIPIRVLDLAGSPSPRAAFDAVLRQEADTPYDLRRGPLFRATIASLGPTEHRIIVGAHHIVCDGWSLGVLLRELGPLYGEARHGRAATLAPAPSFVRNAADEARWKKAADIAHFVSRLRDLPPPLELPTDRPRTPARSVASAVAAHTLDASLVSSLKATSAAMGVTPFVSLFAAWAVLLGRIAGQRDVVIGVPMGLQSHLEERGLVGHCTHLLPIRVRLAEGAGINDTAVAVRTAVLEAMEHPFATFGDLISELSVRRDPRRPPLLSVLFNLDTQFSRVKVDLDGCAASFKPNPRAAELFELFLNGYEEDGRIVLECQYATELWDAGTISAWLRGLEEVLRSLIDDPKTPWERLRVLSEHDRRTVLEAWNATDLPLPAGTMLDQLARVCDESPLRVALEDEEHSLTYEDLLRYVRRTAQALRERGVGPGDLVGLCVERNAFMVVLAMGIWGTGAAYVPIDPAYPPERMRQMVDAAKLVVVDDETEPAIAELCDSRVALETLTMREAEGPLEASPDGVAYVLYTSGSTGAPKGVAVTHENLLNFVWSMRTNPGVGPDDIVAAVVTLSFDIAGFEMFVPLTVGATVTIADRETTQDGRELADFIRNRGVTMVQATPSTFRLLRTAGFSPKGLKALVGGEAFPPELAGWLLDNGAQVTNCYGPTETTIWSTIHPVTVVAGAVPVGTPIANTRIYVLDPLGQPAIVGGVGEVFIGGRGVAQGYRNAPELTRARFLPDPFSAAPGARMYRTGDMGRLRHDGALDLLGRTDDQVKIRGHRVELGEIEAALEACEGVREAAVALLRPGDGEPRIVAAIVAAPGQDVVGTALRRHLRHRLPDSVIPNTFLEVAALPRTPNGKLDRRELAWLTTTETHRDQGIVPPSTATEKLVSDLFGRLLRQRAVGATDNFFDLGGDSMGSMEAVVALERLTSVRLPPRALLLATVGEIARDVDARRGTNTPPNQEGQFSHE